MTTSDEMANYCHEHYDHPLFWCDEKKRLVERKNAEESIRMWRRRKAEEIARKEKDKQEYYELYLKHCPWGKPGGGAPNVDVRRKDITAVGLHSTPTIAEKYRLTSLQPCRYSDYFSKRKKCHDPLASFSHLQHHHHHVHHHVPRLTTHAHTMHAHINTENARPAGIGSSTLAICDVGATRQPQRANTKNGELLEITLKDHPSMSFRNKGHLDIEVRYKPPPACKGKPLLEKIVVTETDKCPLAVGTQTPAHKKETTTRSPIKKCAATMKMEKPMCKDPWGKAGPGGKPWRSPKDVGSTFMKSLGWTNKEMLKELDQDNPVTPAEKPTFRKVRTTKKAPLPMTRCCDMCTCTCPAMSSAAHAKPIQKQKTISPQQQQSIANANAAYKPQKCTSKMDTIKQKICPRFMRQCGGRMDNKNDNHQTTTETSANVCGPPSGGGGGGGGVELVPLLARRRAINRPISLSSTDVTKRTGSNDRLSTAAVDLHYLHDLSAQVTQKRRSTSISQQVDRELSEKHFETFDTYWGRPGHGAPSHIKTKLKLDNLLYGNVDAFTE